MKRYVLAAVLFAAAVTPAAAYTSYVKPNEFWVGEPEVQIEGSYATQFFTPSIALGDTLTVLNPEGQRVAAERIAVTASGTTGGEISSTENKIPLSKYLFHFVQFVTNYL